MLRYSCSRIFTRYVSFGGELSRFDHTTAGFRYTARSTIRCRTSENSMIQLVTYDFHNTIAHCDDWFQLEIRTLFVRVLEAEAPEALERIGADAVADIYRQMRLQVIESGVEIEAVDGLMRVFSQIDVDLPVEAIEARVEQLMRQALITCTPVPHAIESIR